MSNQSVKMDITGDIEDDGDAMFGDMSDNGSVDEWNQVQLATFVRCIACEEWFVSPIVGAVNERNIGQGDFEL